MLEINDVCICGSVFNVKEPQNKSLSNGLFSSSRYSEWLKAHKDCREKSNNIEVLAKDIITPEQIIGLIPDTIKVSSLIYKTENGDYYLKLNIKGAIGND